MAGDGKPVKGRGAVEQVPNRFLKQSYGVVHWEGVDEVEEEVHPTKYLVEHPKTIINPVNSPDLSFKWSLNPYQGCEHGCSDCYARPTHEYWGYSAGLDFERVIIVKRNAPELLEKALRHPKWKAESITVSGNTDCYQPVERREKLTRAVLEVAQRFNQPIAMITKNALVLRDLDILQDMASKDLVSVAISLTTLNEDLRRVLEPRTSTGRNRLRTIEELSRAGVQVHAMIAPIIPALNEPEVPTLLKAAADAGAVSAGYTVLRTNGAVKEVFRAWVQQHYPDRASKIIAQASDLHGGNMNDSTWGRRMKGKGAFAENIERLFKVMRRRYFEGREVRELNSGLFKVPPEGQLDLFN
jgi:DNA repair photolyase